MKKEKGWAVYHTGRKGLCDRVFDHKKDAQVYMDKYLDGLGATPEEKERVLRKYSVVKVEITYINPIK